jgi:adhesin/invasin
MITRTRIASVRLTIFAAAICIFAAGACKLSADDPISLVLGVLSGDNQSTAAGTPLPDSLKVIVVDQFGFSTEGVTVSWAIASGGGSLSAASTTSDVNGVTGVIYTAGPTVGHATITATVTGIGTLTFAATIT